MTADVENPNWLDLESRKFYVDPDEIKITINGVEIWAHWCQVRRDYVSKRKGGICQFCGAYEVGGING